MLSSTVKIDPRVKRTRKLLLDAFFSLLREKRFEEITVQDIAERATVNRATFYAHFVDKYALVDDLIRDSFAEVLQKHMQTPTQNAQEQLRYLLLAVIDHWQGTNTHCKPVYSPFESMIEAQVKGQIRNSLYTWLLTYYPTHKEPQNRLELTATIVSWAIYGAAMEWGKQIEKQTPAAFADQALPLIVASIDALAETLVR